MPSSSTISVPTSPQNGAHPTLANCCQEPLEPGSSRAGARSAKVIIDDLHIAPAQLASPVGEGILAPLALQVVRDLVGCRLANVDDGVAAKVLSADLAHRAPPRVFEPAGRQ